MNLFVECNIPLIKKLQDASEQSTILNMETEFCSVSLDIIGRAVFNYDFGSVANESPLVKAVYRTLQEVNYKTLIPFIFSILIFSIISFSTYSFKNYSILTTNSLIHRQNIVPLHSFHIGIYHLRIYISKI